MTCRFLGGRGLRLAVSLRSLSGVLSGVRVRVRACVGVSACVVVVSVCVVLSVCASGCVWLTGRSSLPVDVPVRVWLWSVSVSSSCSYLAVPLGGGEL